MTLRQRIVLTIGVTLFIAISLLFVFSKFFLFESFSRLEAADTRDNIERAVYALNTRLLEISRMTGDYASWDDSYQFIADHNKKYIANNLNDTTFSNLKINLMIFIDKKGKTVFAKNFDLEENKERPLPAGLLELIKTGSLLTGHISPESQLRGMIMTPQGPLLIGSRPIVTSLQKGPVRGTLIFGRYLDAPLLKILSETTNLSISVRRLTEPDLPADFRAAAASLSKPDLLFTRPLSNDRIAGYIVIRDLNNKPALILRVDLPRQVYQQGQASVFYFAALFIITTLLVIALSIIILERIILARLSRLSLEVSQIGSSRNLSGRVTVDGSDELAELAQALNRTMAALEQAQTERAASEQKFHQLFETAPDAIYLETLDGKISDCNRAAVVMTGYSKAELLGLRSANLVPPEVAKIFPQLVSDLVATGSFATEAANVRKNGEIFPVDFSSTLLTIGGQQYVLAIVRDISARKKTEQQLTERLRELEDFQNAVVSRELKMIELEKEIDRLLTELGRPPKYGPT